MRFIFTSAGAFDPAALRVIPKHYWAVAALLLE